ncbi:hypothetical protein CLOP_g2962 [Closterium sp. NIES-67]|nr:hypothetical protein CLOP_g2962 [Closterium sp. NIES-67]
MACLLGWRRTRSTKEQRGLVSNGAERGPRPGGRDGAHPAGAGVVVIPLRAGRRGTWNDWGDGLHTWGQPITPGLGNPGVRPGAFARGSGPKMGRNDGRRAREGQAGCTAGRFRAQLAPGVANADEPRARGVGWGLPASSGTADSGALSWTGVRRCRRTGESVLRIPYVGLDPDALRVG